MKRWLMLLVLGCGSTPMETDPCLIRGPGDLEIDEVMIDPAGTDSGKEWFELFNPLGRDVDLAGMTVQAGKPDGGTTKTHLIRAGTVPAHGYFTLGDVRSGALPEAIGYSYGADLGAFGSTGTLRLTCHETLIDQMEWDHAPSAGHAWQRDPRSDDWCEASRPYDDADYGTPAASNDPCAPETSSGTCLENGVARAIVAPKRGDLSLTEVMANPHAVSDEAGEWLELHAARPVDLNGVTLSVGSAHQTFDDAKCLHADADHWLLIARHADPSTNGGLPTPFAALTLSLVNTGGVISLSAADAGIDSADVPAAIDGVAWQRDLQGTFCPAQRTFGAGDLGTPGAANDPCDAGSSPVPTGCVDPSTGQTRAYRRPNPGDLVLSEWMPDPTRVTDVHGEWIELRALAAIDLNGVGLTSGSSHATIDAPTCLTAEAGSLFLLARDANPSTNGGLPSVTATFGFDLPNHGGTLALLAPDGGTLDQLDFPAATPGASFFVGAARPATLCVSDATAAYGIANDAGTRDEGTPGTPNPPCP